MTKLQENIYAPNYKVEDGCLVEVRSNRQGPYDQKLCNFLPWLVSEIEMCVKNSTSNMNANSPGWFITEKTLQATIELTKQLMAEHGIPAENVIRHFDVNGKPCPGVVGWNPLTGSEKAWNDFHAAISGKVESKLPYMVRVTIDDLFIRTGPGTGYPHKGYIKPSVYTIVEENGIWLKLKSG